MIQARYKKDRWRRKLKSVTLDPNYYMSYTHSSPHFLTYTFVALCKEFLSWANKWYLVFPSQMVLFCSDKRLLIPFLCFSLEYNFHNCEIYSSLTQGMHIYKCLYLEVFIFIMALASLHGTLGVLPGYVLIDSLVLNRWMWLIREWSFTNLDLLKFI